MPLQSSEQKDVRKALASTGYTMKPATVTKVEANSGFIIENGNL